MMERRTHSESQSTPALYTISPEEFAEVLPGKPDQTSNLDRSITRTNFVRGMIDAFSKSRGHLSAHMFVFEWREIHTGFDYDGTIENYFAAGGYQCLSGEEQSMIVDAFNAVEKHKTEIYRRHLDEFTDDVILENFDANLQRLIEFKRENPQNIHGLSREELEHMPKDQFLRELDGHIKAILVMLKMQGEITNALKI